MKYFSSKIKTSDSQENANLCFSPIFPDGEEVYIYNEHEHQLLSLLSLPAIRYSLSKNCNAVHTDTVYICSTFTLAAI